MGYALDKGGFVETALGCALTAKGNARIHGNNSAVESAALQPRCPYAQVPKLPQTSNRRERGRRHKLYDRTRILEVHEPIAAFKRPGFTGINDVCLFPCTGRLAYSADV